MKICIIGTGKVGSALAILMASKGYQIEGTEINDTLREALNRKDPPYEEADLKEFWKIYGHNVEVFKEVRSAYTYIILVQTPSQPNGSFSMKYILKACEGISNAMPKDGFVNIIISSTINPGDIDFKIKPFFLKRLGTFKDWGLSYCPCLIAQGSIIKDFKNPPIIIIGSTNEESQKRTAKTFLSLVDNVPSVRYLSPINAEIAKLAINFFITMKISYLNTLTELCEKFHGGNIDEVTDTLKEDPRIGGKKLFKGGLGFGGPCFPRDTDAFIIWAENQKGQAWLSEATKRVNKRQMTRVAQMILELSHNGEKIGILGLTYKPGTYLCDESQAIVIANLLVQNGKEVHVYDPSGMTESKRTLDEKAIYHSTGQELVDQCDVILIAVDWEEFKNINYKKKKVIDVWRILEKKKNKNYIGLGMKNL